MLLPFTRRVLSVSEIASRYVPTVISDILKDEEKFMGYLLMHHAEASALLLLEGSEIAAGAFYSPGSGLLLNSCNCKPLMENMGDFLALEIMECEEVFFEMNRVFLTHMPSAVISRRIGFDAVRDRLPLEGSLLLARLNGPLAEFALLDSGSFVCACRFDRNAGNFLNCDESTWESGNTKEHSFWLTLSGTSRINPPEMDDFDDPLMLIVEKYFVVFNHMQEIMDNLYGENTLQELNQLLERYKQKYPPLYRGLYINPETHRINWERMVDNRSRVDVKFRYDRFPLYLDEIMLDFVKLLYERTRIEGIRQLRDLIIKLKEFSPDRDSETSDRFFKKLEKVLRV